MRKNIKRMLVLLFAILLLTGCNLDKSSDKLNSDNILTVATYNISSADREAQRKIMVDNNVNIFGIQEVHYDNISSLDKGIEKVNPIPEFMKDPYIDSYFGKAIDFAGGGYGVAVISDRKMKDSTTTPLYMGDPSPEAFKIFEDVYRAFDPTKPETRDAMNNMKAEGINGEMVLEPRVYSRSIIDVNGKEVAFYNTHMSYEDDDIRDEQMEQLYEAMKADTVEYKIAVGDFNLLATTEMNIWKDDFTVANGNNGVWIDTYTVEYDSMYMYSIDNIIVSKNIEIKDLKVVQSDLSDHLPLIAELELK